MKKHLITAYILLLSFATIFSLYIPKSEVAATEETVIPNEAIRLRILANSDAEDDQNLKRKVRDAVNAEITLWVQDLTSLEEARTTIKNGLPEIQKIAEKVVAEENEHQSVKVDFGKVDFPTKLYGQFLYPAGEYEAILITLGEGEGANWWCVLFPPLCFLDFSNGVAVSEGFEEDKPKGSKKQSSEKVAKAETYAKVEAEEIKTDSAEANAKTASDEVSSNEQAEENQTETMNTDVEEIQTASNNKTTQENAKIGQEVKAEAQVSKIKEAEVKAESTTTATTKTATTDDSEKENSKQSKVKEDKTVKTASKTMKAKEAVPVYAAEDEQEVEVKFFIVEIWTKIF